MADTLPMSGRETQAQNIRKGEEDRLTLARNIIFEGEKDSYEILSDRRIGGGGESQVYMAKRCSDGMEVVAKIYDKFEDTPLGRRNRKRVIGFLATSCNFRETHIMPLHDYGMVSIESEDGEDFRKPVDIIPFCRDGELKQCDYMTLKAKVIPGILTALHLMHTANLVHRDVKPGNLYLYEGETVIGDFGTASEINPDGDKTYEFMNTRQKRGTLGYTAPEVWQGYAVFASDYFSFGCTIASLYKGEHVYQRLIDICDEGAINKAIKSNGLPLGCTERESDLQSLVDALVLVDEAKRAEYPDVRLWLTDTEAFIRGWKHKQQQEAEPSAFSFHFEKQVCHNEVELTAAMVDQWDAAKDYLYRGGVRNSAIINFFSRNNQVLSVKAAQIIEAQETATNYDLGLARFLHYLNTVGTSAKCPIYWRGATYHKLSDISAALSGKTVDREHVITMLKSRFLSWKLENTEEARGSGTLETIKGVENMAAEFPELACYALMYKLAPAETERALTPNEIFASYTAKSGTFYRYAQMLLSDEQGLAYFIKLGFEQDVLTLKRSLTGKLLPDLELIYRLFEAICDDKAAVREHYFRCGPQSYLYWFQQHLDLYLFNSAAAKTIEARIKGVRLARTMTISDMYKEFARLKEYQKDFISLFQHNILLAYMGIHNGRDRTGITSTNTDAFFVEDFFGTSVPAGYKRYIGVETANQEVR